MQWQCKLCESHSLKQAYDLGACALLECSTCGFRFIDYLDSDWASVNVTDEAAIAKTVEFIKSGLESNRERIASCIDLVQLYVPNGPILDVGAGGGSFLARISESFPGSLGIELAPVLYEICRRAGLQISREPLESTQWDGHRGAFGAVSMWDVIEHVNDPWRCAEESGSFCAMAGYFSWIRRRVTGCSIELERPPQCFPTDAT
jgi:Methyltransferase domain